MVCACNIRIIFEFAGAVGGVDYFLQVAQGVVAVAAAVGLGLGDVIGGEVGLERGEGVSGGMPANQNILKVNEL